MITTLDGRISIWGSMHAPDAALFQPEIDTKLVMSNKSRRPKNDSELRFGNLQSTGEESNILDPCLTSPTFSDRPDYGGKSRQRVPCPHGTLAPLRGLTKRVLTHRTPDALWIRMRVFLLLHILPALGSSIASQCGHLL